MAQNRMAECLLRTISGSQWPPYTPDDETLRILWLLLSATYTSPLESTLTPDGELKMAAVPRPSAQVNVPIPASVVTTPVYKHIMQIGLTIRNIEMNSNSDH